MKRRKIHGEAVKKHVSILDANLGNETGFLKAAYLCHKCIGTLESLEARRREVFKMEAKVVSKLRKIVECPRGSESEDDSEKGAYS